MLREGGRCMGRVRTEETSAADEEVNATIEEMTSLAGQLRRTAENL